MRLRQATIGSFLMLVTTTLTIAYSTGPPDAHTNAPGENNCTQCHTTAGLNTAPGSVTVIAPPTYSAGDTLTISIALQKPGQLRWGFEITALNAANVKFGTLIVTDIARTQKSVSVREYVKHTQPGTDAGTPNVAPGWSLKWAAPLTAGGGPVTFYAAGNAANNSGNPPGDFIYTTSTTVAEIILPCCTGSTGNVDCSGIVDIGDLTVLIDHLFISFAPLCCYDEGNVDASGIVDIGDLTMLIDHLFISFAPLPSCP